MEKVESFKFLGIHITNTLKWSTHTDSVLKKAQQKFGLSPKTLTKYYVWTIKSIQNDHQGQQPPESLPVHPATIQKARSVQVHQSWEPRD
jgi:hypothetical protein